MNAGAQSTVRPGTLNWSQSKNGVQRGEGAKTAPSVTVAVIGDGLDSSHPALKDSIFIPEGTQPEPTSGPNGTHVAGIIAGAGKEEKPEFSMDDVMVLTTIPVGTGNLSKPSVGAPGVDTLTTVPSESGHTEYSGTRLAGTGFAAPVVTGMAAQILSENPDMSPTEVFAELYAKANELGWQTNDR